MLSKTHRYGGAVAGMLLIDTYLYQYTNFPEQLVFLAGAVIGSLVPDIDMQGSKIQQVAPNVGNSIRGSVSSLANGFGDEKFRKSIDSHRGICHSLLSCLAILITLSILGLFFEKGKKPIIYCLILGIILGILSHIFLDLLNPKGVQLFAPISNKRFKLLNIVTGSFTEKIIKFIFQVILFFAVTYLLAYYISIYS